MKQSDKLIDTNQLETQLNKILNLSKKANKTFNKLNDSGIFNDINIVYDKYCVAVAYYRLEDLSIYDYINHHDECGSFNYDLYCHYREEIPFECHVGNKNLNWTETDSYKENDIEGIRYSRDGDIIGVLGIIFDLDTDSILRAVDEYYTIVNGRIKKQPSQIIIEADKVKLNSIFENDNIFVPNVDTTKTTVYSYGVRELTHPDMEYDRTFSPLVTIDRDNCITLYDIQTTLEDKFNDAEYKKKLNIVNTLGAHIVKAGSIIGSSVIEGHAISGSIIGSAILEGSEKIGNSITTPMGGALTNAESWIAND